MNTQEKFQPVTVPANTVTPIVSDNIGGFFATAAGVVTIAGTNDVDGSARTIVSFTATANTWYPLPFYIGPRGGTITTDALAAGVLAA